MNQIRPWLHIGKYAETKSYPLLKQEGITAMFLLAEPVSYPDIDSVYLAVEDGEPLPIDKIEQGIAILKQQHATGETILVACGAGISRSATYCILALKEIEGVDLFEAFRQIKAVHPGALPHKDLWESICAYYGESIHWIKILRDA